MNNFKSSVSTSQSKPTIDQDRSMLRDSKSHNSRSFVEDKYALENQKYQKEDTKGYRGSDYYSIWNKRLGNNPQLDNKNYTHDNQHGNIWDREYRTNPSRDDPDSYNKNGQKSYEHRAPIDDLNNHNRDVNSYFNHKKSEEYIDSEGNPKPNKKGLNWHSNFDKNQQSDEIYSTNPTKNIQEKLSSSSLSKSKMAHLERRSNFSRNKSGIDYTDFNEGVLDTSETEREIYDYIKTNCPNKIN